MVRRLSIAVLVLICHASFAQEIAPTLERPLGGGNRLLIPAAANNAGANGTFFRSDVTITNFRTDADQAVAFQWLPQGQSGVGIPSRMANIPRASGIVSEDFVNNVMQQEGLGAILVTTIGPADGVDPNGQLHAVSRVWTPQPGTNGTTSQSLPVLRVQDIVSERLTILGQRLDSRYRTNVGIVNLDTGVHSFRITTSGTSTTGTAHPPEQMTVTVNGLSMQQVALPNTRQYGVLQIHVEIVPDTFGVLTLWTAYGSSVDNITGDAWSSIGFTAPPDEL
jgi:hypothetical protein